MHKDMRLATATVSGQDGASAMPLLEALRERLRQAEERGGANEDFSSLIKLL